ncbi:MAG: VWA domain-containing protein [Phycisphaera sp.]|nr:MAG: VWA domain-containing protein [Phycisphaera sp.]
MRQIAFDNHWWLMVAIAAVPLGVMALAAFRTMSRTRRGSAAIARVVLFSLLALALAGASGIRQSDRMAVVVVADVSGSVLRYGPAAEGQEGAPTLAMRRFIEASGQARGSEDLLGVVAFADDPLPVFSPTAGPVADRALPELPDGGTNIAAALNAAAAMIPPDAAGRIVLISDGNQTVGNALEAADRLARARALGEGARGGLPIDTVAIDYRVQREVLVEFVDAPPRAARGSTVPIRIGLRSTSPAAGTLRLLMDGRDIGVQRRVLLDAGRSAEVFEVPLPEGRIHRFEAVFEPEEQEGLVADTTLANNSGEAFTISPGDGSVLIVHRPGSTESDTLASTLEGLDLAIEQRPPLGVPTDLVGLEAYDLIILAGVGADEVPTDAQAAIASFVTQLGGGLVMMGGQRSFGSGGWRGSPIEPILPVHLDLPQLVQTPEVAIAIVLDNSGSMNRSVLGSSRSQQQIANEAAAIAVLNLHASDQVCVISFNSSTRLVVPIAPNANPRKTAQTIRSIPSGGGTRVGPALRMAAEQLGSVDAKSRHIIVLTDGLSMDADVLPSLAKQIRGQDITISTIAVGDSADTESMKKVAEAADGTFYNVVNPNVLPQVFLSEVQVTRTPLVREGDITPVVLPTPSPATAGLPTPPPLTGINLTRAKQEPTITLAMATRQGEPLLAHWNAGVGQVAAFTSDSQQWAKRWIDWPGYEQFWGQLVRSMSRSTEDSGLTMRVQQEDGRIRLEVEAIDDTGATGDAISALATVYDPQGRSVETSFTQVGPGTYEATATADDPGSYVVVVRPTRDGRGLPPMLAGVSVSGGQEYRMLASDVDRLEAIARATGGRVLSFAEASRVFDRGDIGPSEARSPLWRLLLAWALAVLVLDIGTRRVAWDRLVSSAFGAEWLRATAVLGKQGKGAATAVGTLRESGGAKGDQRVRRARGGDVDVSATESDAQRSAHEAQQRILRARAERMATQAAPPPQPHDTAKPDVDPATKPTDDTSNESGLLAAKRRARQRFED